jgi:hypothetical protein
MTLTGDTMMWEQCRRATSSSRDAGLYAGA